MFLVLDAARVETARRFATGPERQFAPGKISMTRMRNLVGFYEAWERFAFDRFLHVQAWLARGRRGLEVTAG